MQPNSLRISALFAAVLLGWLLGQGLGSAWGLLGAWAGVAVWVWWDARAQQRVLNWLKQGESAAPVAWGVWADVADRAQRALRQQQRKTASARRRLDEFLLAIQASPNGVVLLDHMGRMEWCNSAASDHLGIDANDDLGQPLRNIVRDPAFSAYMQSEHYEREVQFAGPRDSSGETLIAAQLFAYGQKRFLLLSRDVTAIRRAERMRRDFVANVSHEIKTPLTVIRGFVEALQELPLEAAQQRHYIDLMGAQAQRMNSLVTDLLSLSSLEGSPPPPAHEWSDGLALARQVMADAQSLNQILHNGLQHLHLRTDAALQVAGNARELASAMGNLLSNAVRYTPAAGSIQVGWSHGPGGSAEFVVGDNGPGIAPIHLTRLSERFYRVDQSRSRETGGTGLGLAIVKHIAARHGGELLISSTLGEGSRFALRLPARRVRWAQASAVTTAA